METSRFAILEFGTEQFFSSFQEHQESSPERGFAPPPQSPIVVTPTVRGQASGSLANYSLRPGFISDQFLNTFVLMPFGV